MNKYWLYKGLQDLISTWTWTKSLVMGKVFIDLLYEN